VEGNFLFQSFFLLPRRKREERRRKRVKLKLKRKEKKIEAPTPKKLIAREADDERTQKAIVHDGEHNLVFQGVFSYKQAKLVMVMVAAFYHTETLPTPVSMTLGFSQNPPEMPPRSLMASLTGIFAPSSCYHVSAYLHMVGWNKGLDELVGKVYQWSWVAYLPWRHPFRY